MFKSSLFLLSLVLSMSASLAQTPGNIESAEYDPTANRWFISNGSSILQTSDGGNSYAYFGTVSATHGMEVVDGMLVVIAGGTIRAIDLETEQVLGSINISGAGFLNGMGSRSGEVIVSDFSTAKIHRVDISDPANMTSEIIVPSTGTTPNGVVIDEANNRAVIVNWGNNADILAVDLETGLLSTLIDGTGIGNLDGIDIDADGNFYVSSWSPARITKYTNDFSESETVVQGAGSGLGNPADISYAWQTDTLGVANSGNGTPSFHYFGDTSDLTNPIEHDDAVEWDGIQLTFSSMQGGQWNCMAYNVAGQLIAEASLELPAAPTRVTPEQMGWTGGGSAIWQFTSPAGQTHAVRPGLRLQ